MEIIMCSITSSPHGKHIYSLMGNWNKILTILTSDKAEQTGNTSREIFTNIVYTEDVRSFHMMNEYLKVIIWFFANIHEQERSQN